MQEYQSLIGGGYPLLMEGKVKGEGACSVRKDLTAPTTGNLARSLGHADDNHVRALEAAQLAGEIEFAEQLLDELVGDRGRDGDLEGRAL